jgi:hypothetical protein
MLTCQAGLGRECGRPGRQHGNGHVSHVGHGGRLTNRRWPWPRWRQAGNRPGTPGGYLAEGLIPPGPAIQR